MLKNEKFPQEWASYLQINANIEPILGTSPVGIHTLSFERMSSTQFEQFCWWLLQKDHELKGCYWLGDTGNKTQGGIDLFAYNYRQPSELIVFECKCWKSFDSSDLEKAVNRFLNGSWVHETAYFVLILAQSTIQNLGAKWNELQRKLLAHNVIGELWTGIDLTKRTQNYPSILTKFFPQESIIQFCNDWMVKESFIENLHKANNDPRPTIKRILNNYLNEANEEINSDQIIETETSWQIKTLELDIYALLPTIKNSQYLGSASITIKNHDTHGVLIVLDQQWLLNNFLGSDGAPLENQLRPFITGLYEEQYIIDFKNCRFYLSEHIVKQIAKVADQLTATYLSALQQLEINWEAEYFPFISYGYESKVALCVIDSWLWDAIIDFSYEYDFDNGNTDWHIFQKNPNLLMLLNTKEKYFYTVIEAKRIEEFCNNEQVAILWQPPRDFSLFKPNEYWGSKTSYRWFINKLIPKIADWLATKESLKIRDIFNRNGKRALVKRKFLESWQENVFIKNIQIIYLLENHTYASIGLIKTIEVLQGFYNGAGRCKRAYFTDKQMKNLYKAISILAKGGRGYIGCIVTKLGIPQTISDISNHDQLNIALNEFIKKNNFPMNTYIIECNMRAMLELIDDNENWIAEHDKTTIFQYLKPFMSFYDQQMLIDRHSLYIY